MKQSQQPKQQPPMVPLKKGGYLVILSQDKTAWVVCGHLCARRVTRSAAPTKEEAVKQATQK